MDIPLSAIQVIKNAIEEDIGHGDVTSSLIIPEESESRALYVAKGDFVLAGIPFAREVFKVLDQNTIFETFIAEGAKVRKGDILGEVSGRTRVLLAGERVSLNILQRLSGIATLTSSFVDAVAGTGQRSSIHGRPPPA
jgi:nicotinate-nucleotide pyrophosphorylase (carboxylating)